MVEGEGYEDNDDDEQNLAIHIALHQSFAHPTEVPRYLYQIEGKSSQGKCNQRLFGNDALKECGGNGGGQNGVGG